MTTLLGTSAPPAAAGELQWYKDAIIYQLHVRSFYDSNADGIGDFPGLTSKLDYITALGATCVWLLPFYPSPLRDEGYDIGDYCAIHPTYGGLEDFQQFLTQAHERGLKVITELVINHTSDQHPWFQQARRAPKGSPERERYVWSDTADKYAGVRIIFRDFETSNWTWDPVAQQYFWHRFYSHQPDLNFDNPLVQRDVFEIADFWLGMGVDGLRLDAIPYLFEREGTNCESLPETHEYLKTLRRYVDEKHPGRMLLAEANQWPDETAAYFGEGDECHTCFHFPLMPRLFLALQQENRFPIVDIMRQTPTPPPPGQWAIFLRNHDELTLEMVSEEERLLMYRTYAADMQSRINLGVRRRLAPLLRNDRRKTELLHALLLSLPGTPVLYYGDELRMGDNIYLKDRDAVRTPMQWAPDRNAGFSTGNPQRMFLPPIIDPEFHYQTRNVETQEASPHSFLWWLRRVLRLRRSHTTFGRGSLEFLESHNPHVLSFLRRGEGEVLLVVVNLSRLSQFVELNLAEFRGRNPIELFGSTRFPPIGELPYLLTLGPHSFYWFQLEFPAGQETRLTPEHLPAVEVSAAWTEILEPAGQRRLEWWLPYYLARQPWLPGGTTRIRRASMVDHVRLAAVDGSDDEYLLCLVQVEFVDGITEKYQLVLLPTTQQRAALIMNDRPGAGLARLVVRKTGETLVLCDATAETGFWRALSSVNGARPRWRSGREMRVVDVESDWRPANPAEASVTSFARSRQQDAATALVDGRFLISLFRRIEEGPHPEEELGLAMRTAPPPKPSPRLYAGLYWSTGWAFQGRCTLGLIHENLEFEQKATKLFGGLLRRVAEDCVAVRTAGEEAAPPETLLSDDGKLVLSTLSSHCGLLGQALGEWHRYLASLPGEFAPEQMSQHYRRSVFEAMRASLSWVAETNFPAGDETLLKQFHRVEERQAEIVGVMSDVLRLPLSQFRIRCHGNLTLDALLWNGTEFGFQQWGGDRTRPLAERRIKRAGLRDVATLICSLLSLADDQAVQLGEALDPPLVARCLRASLVTALRSLIAGYRVAVAGLNLTPENDDAFTTVLRSFVMNAAVEQLQNALLREDPAAQSRALRLFPSLPEIVP